MKVVLRSWLALVLAALGLLVTASRVEAAGEPAGSMATTRYGHTSATLPGGRVLVSGGYTTTASSTSMTTSAEVYDAAANTFAATGALAAARAEHAAAALADGRVLVLGGLGPSGSSTVNLASAEIYDPAAGTWSPTTGSMAAARRAPVALTLADGRVLVIGGDATLGACELFDPATGTFSPTGPLIAGRTRFAASLLPDGRVLVVGGRDIASNYLSGAEIWDPVAGLWNSTGTMAFARYGATATTLTDGRVLVVGGSSTSSASGSIGPAELYNPATGTFTATGALNIRRYGHAAALMGDGNVVVSGGTSGVTSVLDASAERYDVAAGTWRNLGLLSISRTNHTASLLANGDVLIAGGYGFNASSALVVHATAEIIDPACVATPPSLSPASASFTMTGGTGSIGVTHGAGCSWKVTRAFSPFTLTSGGEGVGNGTVTYSLAANTSTSTITMRPLVADTEFVVTQTGDACATASLSPTSTSFSASAANRFVSLSTLSACAWTVSGAPSWLTVVSGGTGSASIQLSALANAGAARSATLTIAGRSHPVTQSGNPCLPAPTISPASQSVSSSNGTAIVAVTAPATCPWTVTGLPSWVTSNISSVAGNMNVTLTHQTNFAATSRTATISIAGNSYTLTQAANPCAGSTVTPGSVSVAAGGGTATFTVTAPAACTWTVTGKPSWITSASGGTGDGTITMSVAANNDAARSASLSMAGWGVTVNQAASPCLPAPTLSSSQSSAITAAGGYHTVTVNAPQWVCAWTVSGAPPWITIDAGGVGQVTLRYGIAPNPGAARSTTFTIANRSYTVTQAAAQAAIAPFMAAARYNHAAAVLQDGRVLVVGGETVAGSSGSMTAAAEIYDPATNTFSPTGALSHPRSTMRATTLTDGRVLVAGGTSFSGGGAWTPASAEIFDPAAGTWSTVPMGAGRGAPLQVLLQDGRVLVVGGGWSDGTAEIFDPATGAFTPTGSMNISRRTAAAALLDDGRVLVMGGNLGPGPVTASAEIWNPATGTWTATGNLALAREHHAAIRLANGKVLVTGGVSGASGASELYDPAAGTFSATGALNVARSHTAAVLLPEGDVLLVGGLTSSATKSLERYDVGTGLWRTVGELREARSSPTASLLLDGKVLIAGGFPGPSSSAEVRDSTCDVPALSPASQGFAMAGGDGSVSFTRGAACAWAVTGLPAWITLTSDASGTGGATVTYSVAANSGAARSATLVIAGRSFVVSQASNPCSAAASLSPVALSLSAAAGMGDITVTTAPGCAFSVANVPAWITITSGSPGVGSGTISYFIAANTGGARSVGLAIGNNTFTVSQAAAAGAGCNFVGILGAGVSFNGTLAAGDCTGGARGTGYYTDRYSFDGSPGQLVAFQLTSSAFDTYMYLRNPSGTVIASNDDGGGGTNSRIPASSGVFTIPAGATGTYVIEVTSYSSGSTGAYSIWRTQ